MRATLSFLTTTSSTAAEWPSPDTRQSLEVLGWDRATRRLYLVEHGAPGDVLYVMATSGEHAGTALPLSGDAARIATKRAELTPLERGERRGWELHTRVVQRRGLKLAEMATPVRKFALGVSLTQREAGLAIAYGRATVTAYLRPRAALEQVWTVPGEPVSIAIVAYCGVPAGVGFDRHTAVLAIPSLQ